MKWSKRKKLHVMCTCWPKTHGVLADPNDGRPVLVATNGRAIAVVRAEGAACLSTPLMIPHDAVELAVRRDAVDPNPMADVDVFQKQTIVTARGVTITCADDAKDFPNWRSVIPDVRPSGDPPAAGASVTISPKLLWELALALGRQEHCDAVTIVFTGDDTMPILVLPREDGCEDRGAIMPIRR